MARSRGDKGMTLIEILLALIVMVLGVIGILALFPAALQSSKESMEETQASFMVESVSHALEAGMQFPAYDPVSGNYDVTLTHDLYVLSPVPATSTYKFTLPKLQDPAAPPVWKHHPGDTNALPDPANDPLFKLAGDGWIFSTVKYVNDTNDPSDKYGQFGFSFAIRKVNTLAYLLNTPNPDKPGTNYSLADLEALTRLYEYRIHAFRGGDGPGGGVASGGGGAAAPVQTRLIATVTNRISLK